MPALPTNTMRSTSNDVTTALSTANSRTRCRGDISLAGFRFNLQFLLFKL